QTYPNTEIIAIDDGSTDATAAHLERFGGRIIVRRQRNAGVAAARNAGASKASGEWIAFLDADDIWLPNKLERQLAAATAPLVYTNRYNIGARKDVPAIQTDCTSMYEGDVFLPLLLTGNFITMSSVLVRRDLFEQMNGFCEALGGTEDWDLWLRIAEGHPIRWCPEPLVCYRFHAGGASRNDRVMRRQRQLVIARAMRLKRARGFDWSIKRRIQARGWMTTAVDAG